MLTQTADGRRLVRPLFMTPDGKKPLPSKKWYDLFTFIATQTTFSFCTAPFVLLSFSDTMRVWSGVYFYTLIAVAGSFALFSRSFPIRHELVKRQAARAPAPTDNIEQVAKEEVEKSMHRRELLRAESHDGTGAKRAPTLGIADDPEAEIDEIVAEVKREFDERKRRGSIVQGFDVKKAVQEKLNNFRNVPSQ